MEFEQQNGQVCNGWDRLSFFLEIGLVAGVLSDHDLASLYTHVILLFLLRVVN